MREQLISFETAKLAKEKGFFYKGMMYRKGGTLSDGKGFMSNLDLYSAPTQSLLQKWLREKHKIHCLADCNAVGWAWFIETTEGTHIKSGDYKAPIPESGRWETYEEALEAGLKEALNLI